MYSFRGKSTLAAMFFLLLISIKGSGQTQKTDSLAGVVDSLIYATEFEKAQRLILDYLEAEEPSELERLRLKMLYAEVIRSSALPRKAIFAFKDALKSLPEMANREMYRSRIYMSIAGCYFDIRNYNRAA